MCSKAVVPNLESPDVFGLNLPEAFTTSCVGQDFWEKVFLLPSPGLSELTSETRAEPILWAGVEELSPKYKQTLEQAAQVSSSPLPPSSPLD